MKHTREKQVQVLTDLSVHGNVRKAARDHGVSKTTVHTWVAQAKSERGELASSVPLEGEIVGTPGQSIAAVPLPLPLEEDWSTPVWVQVEQRALEVVALGVETLAAQQRTQPLTPSETYTMAKLAEVAHRIRTGTDRLSPTVDARQLTVVFTEPPTRE